MIKFKRFCVLAILWCGCANLIRAVWGTLEIALYGAVAPDQVDTIINVLFSTTLWWILRGWLVGD